MFHMQHPFHSSSGFVKFRFDRNPFLTFANQFQEMTPKKYKHLFFDLDRTLWDFETSSKITFEYLFKKYELEQKGIENVGIFHQVYSKINEKLWDQYRNGQIEKEVLRDLRFKQTLDFFGIKDENLDKSLGCDYIYYSPRNVSLMPFTMEILEYLHPKYKLHIITNGFEEVQHVKLESSKMDTFFDTMTISEEVGTKKPDKRIFNYALKKANAQLEESLMIGDDLEVDIEGAINVGMDQVFFNVDGVAHQKKVDFEIGSLSELKRFL